jgi:hypothetical protein
MIFVPYSNEPSNLSLSAVDRVSGVDSGHHINTYWTSTNRVHNEEISAMLTRMARPTESPGGIGIINHAGRNTGALRDNVSENEARRISNRREIFEPYAQLFMEHTNLLGLEIVNKLDPETRADRVLWDNILRTTMPHGRPVWGSATDDAHHTRDVGFAYNLMLMPNLSLSEFRRSLESGAFFAFSRVSQDTNYRIYPGAIEDWLWLGRELSSSNAESVHGRSVPQISSIAVNDSLGTITINATGFDSIRWYADGEEIFRGATLNLSNHATAINSYVRATVVSNSNGVLYVQPFGIQRDSPRALHTLQSIENATSQIVLPRGVLKTQMGFRLPGGVQITTSNGATSAIRPAAVMWQDLASVSYNPLSPRCQNFTVTGNVFIDPNRFANPANVSTAVSAEISVPCMPSGCECSLCNECGTCRFCDPCLRCTGTCRSQCTHRNCTKIFHCETCAFCTRAPEQHDYRWLGGEGTYIGNHSFIRAFPLDLRDRFDDLRSIDSELRIAFAAPGAPSGRRILVWTDLTGEPNTSMVSSSNINASRVIRTESGISQGDTSVRLTIPRHMFYDSGSGQFATMLYVVATTNSTNFHEQPTGEGSSGIFRTDLTDVISNITISVTGLPVWREGGFPPVTTTPTTPSTTPTTPPEPISGDFEIAAVIGGVILIRNTTDRLQTTRGLSLSNSSANLRQWRMPSLIVQPGATVQITTGTIVPDLKRSQANFMIAPGQQLRITDAQRNVISLFET